MTNILKREMAGSALGRAALLFGSRCMRSFRKKLDYEEYGGAPLLGINGVGIVCHGGSSSRAIKNAVKMAAQYVNNKVLEKMAVQIKGLQSKRTDPGNH
jgi:glycerol-3-phosphate acyltransferase PlsX